MKKNTVVNEMNGVVNLFKPLGLSSAAAVGVVKRKTGAKKAGHTGTLDPGACGVLPICLGNATRLAEFIQSEKKKYRTVISFGKATDTQDSFGKVIAERPVPAMEKKEFEDFLNSNFKGEIQQVPPMYSALKKEGVPLYRMARQGLEVERKSRKITIYDINVSDYSGGKAVIDIECSTGTYIRTLCHDIGEQLGSAAYMSFLLRSASGIFTVENSIMLEDIDEKTVPVPPADALPEMEEYILTPSEEEFILNGRSIVFSRTPVREYPIKLLSSSGRLTAIARCRDNKVIPEKVFKN